MKNLIKGHIYQLKKDYFFLGCIIFSLIYLGLSIKFNSLRIELTGDNGIETMINSFLSVNIILYAFMLLTSNTVSETYRSGIMKNIIGRGIKKKNYYISMVLIMSVICLTVIFIYSLIMGYFAFTKVGMGAISYPIYHLLSVIIRIIFIFTYISFAVTASIITKNAITGFILSIIIPYIPKFLEIFLSIFKINISFDFLKISHYIPSFYDASNDLSFFIPSLFILLGYLCLSLIIGINIFKKQDIK